MCVYYYYYYYYYYYDVVVVVAFYHQCPTFMAPENPKNTCVPEPVPIECTFLPVMVTPGTPGTYVVALAAELPEGLDVEPGALVARRVQGHPHGVLLQQRREPLVHRQVLVGLDVQQLKNTSYLKMTTSGTLQYQLQHQ